MKYSTIIKPTDKSGSRGIYKVDLAEETLTVLKELADKSFEKALIEEFAKVQEYSVEHISYNGKHYFQNLTQNIQQVNHILSIRCI